MLSLLSCSLCICICLTNKSVKEIVSMDHVKSLQEVKNLYKLTEEEAQKLKAEVIAARNGEHIII